MNELIVTATEKMQSELDLSEEVTQRLIDNFLKSLPELFAKIQKEYQHLDEDELKNSIHMLKGLAGNLRFENLYKVTNDFNIAITSNNNIDIRNELFSMFETAVQEVLAD